MQKDKRDIQQGLSRKGFKESERTHHTYYFYFTADGKKTPVKTRVSRGSKYKSLGEDLIGKMAQQCNLSKDEFLDLINCPLSRGEYEAHLQRKRKL